MSPFRLSVSKTIKMAASGGNSAIIDINKELDALRAISANGPIPNADLSSSDLRTMRRIHWGDYSGPPASSRQPCTSYRDHFQNWWRGKGIGPIARLQQGGLLPLWDFLKWQQHLPAHLNPIPETTYTQDFGDHETLSRERQSRLQRLRDAKDSAQIPENAFYCSVYKCDFTPQGPPKSIPRLQRRDHDVLQGLPEPTPTSVYCEDFGKGERKKRVHFLPPLRA